MSLSRPLPLCVSAFALTLAACGSPEPREPAPSPTPSAPAASALTRDAVEKAVFAAPVTAPPINATAAPAQPDPAVIRAQILLDRARFGPGVIDGLGGDNTRQAIAAYEKSVGLPQDGVLDAQVFARLTGTDAAAVLMDYTVTAADLAGPFIGTVPTDLEAQSKLATVGYATPLEALAEKFHVTEDLLRALNPGADFGKAGQRLLVPAVGPTDLPPTSPASSWTRPSARSAPMTPRIACWPSIRRPSAVRPAPRRPET